MTATTNSRHRKKKKNKAALLILELLILLILAALAFAATKFMKINTTPLDNSNISINEDISDESQKIMDGYMTIVCLVWTTVPRRSDAGAQCVIMIARPSTARH